MFKEKSPWLLYNQDYETIEDVVALLEQSRLLNACTSYDSGMVADDD
jgi:hypothetical protein